MQVASVRSTTAADKSAGQEKQDRAAALQQLRSHERAQLEKLRQLKQRRRNQQLLEEQRQVEELYRNTVFDSAAATAPGRAGIAPLSHSTDSSQKQTGNGTGNKQHGTAPTPSTTPELEQLAVKPQTSHSAKPGNQLQNFSNPVRNLPSFSSVNRVAAATAPGSRGRTEAAKLQQFTQQTAATNATAATAVHPIRSAVSASRGPTAADTSSSSVSKQLRRGSLSPAGRVSLSPAARPVASPATGDRHSSQHQIGVYDRPWRANMKSPSSQPAPVAAAPAAGGSAVNAAVHAAAQLLSAAADANKPVVVKSKKRSAEEQAQLKVCSPA